LSQLLTLLCRNILFTPNQKIYSSLFCL